MEQLKAQRTSGEGLVDNKSADVVEEVGTDSSRDFISTFVSEARDDQTIISLAERLLFPQDNLDDSGTENSDWIVSDGEDDYFDVKELLKDTEDGEERILYHTEEEEDDGGGVFVLEDLNPLSHSSPPPLLLHEAVCGEDGSGGEREDLKKALELCKAPGLLNTTNSQGCCCC